MRFPSGQPSWQNGTPQSMQRAPWSRSCGSGRTPKISRWSRTRSPGSRSGMGTRWMWRKPLGSPMVKGRAAYLNRETAPPAVSYPRTGPSPHSPLPHRTLHSKERRERRSPCAGAERRRPRATVDRVVRRFLTPVLCLLVLVALVVGIWAGGHPKVLPGFVRDPLVGDSQAQVFDEALDTLTGDYY